MIEAVFWTSLGWIAYVYAGYPLLLGLLAWIKGKGDAVDPPSPLPFVTLIVSAYNEEQVIGAKVENALTLDYPEDQFEVIVVSDACSDRTDEIVQSFTDVRVRLLRMPQRGGKTAGLNAAVQCARGEIIVFSDANAMYVAGAMRALVAPFEDPEVGAVTGEQRYHAADSGSAGEGEGIYWKYELWIKRMESRVSSAVGGDGAIYAIRKHLYWPMKSEDVSDFVNPLQVVMAGYRNVFARGAIAYEHSGDSDDKEFRRKVRIVNQSWRACRQMPLALNPFRQGLQAWQLLSHKVMRWWVFVPLILLFVSSSLLIGRSSFYSFLWWAQTLCYLLAVVGAVWPSFVPRPRITSIPLFFLLVNVASARGIFESYVGKTYATWSTVRE